MEAVVASEYVLVALCPKEIARIEEAERAKKTFCDVAILGTFGYLWEPDQDDIDQLYHDLWTDSSYGLVGREVIIVVPPLEIQRGLSEGQCRH